MASTLNSLQYEFGHHTCLHTTVPSHIVSSLRQEEVLAWMRGTAEGVRGSTGRRRRGQKSDLDSYSSFYEAFLLAECHI